MIYMNNKEIEFKISSLILILGILVVPFSAFAQTAEPEVTESPEIATPVDTSTDSSAVVIPLVNPDPSVENVSPQDTSSEQVSASSGILENTSNPQENGGIIDTSIATGTPVVTPIATSTPVVVVVDPATSNPAPQPVSIPTPIVTPVTTITPEYIVPTPVEQFTAEELLPEKEYTFTLETNSIATKKVPDWAKDTSKKNISNTQVYAVPTFTTDPDTGNLSVSGTCVDPYFVVLIYGKAEDYNTSPTSYIFNKAFDCKSGQYFYEIKDLPDSVRKGRYYLLIGGQGTSGSWKPITALTPMNIEKETNDTTNE
jgi:hypothetical protein